LFEADGEVGGQFRYAREVPGKEDFHDTLRYFRRRIELLGVELRLATRATAAQLSAAGYDEIVVATGVAARALALPGAGHPKAITYPELLSGRKAAGSSVAIIGAGGIGFDVATYLTTRRHANQRDAEQEFFDEWGIDREIRTAGGLATTRKVTPLRKVWLLQRKTTRVGAGLGRTTGWVHRNGLAHRGVEMLAGVSYERIDDAGLHITIGTEARVLPADSVIICAGQESVATLVSELQAIGRTPHVIGGAKLAAELDAERAIREGTELAARL
jgi:2,4-dienoyl-CoA reductase (NADPH2)